MKIKFRDLHKVVKIDVLKPALSGDLSCWCSIYFGKNPDDSNLVLKEYNSEELLNLIQSRRSVRKFKSENVESDKLDKIKNMINWVPTGCNFHKLHFSFIDDIDTMNEFRDYVNAKIINIITKTPVKGLMNKFSSYKKAFLNGEDVIFRKAPHMVVVSVPVNAPCANIDPVIALSYFELYADSLGLGTLWCGFWTNLFAGVSGIV